ncbi:MAG: ATP-dependent DNA ligase [Candidatus Aenigmarchaeota archaeon]|nr:ATP-dependent DNA ligase [Candidatus Aenigmarchaeota archaeon]
MEYSILADVYEKLESISSKLEKTHILADLFSKTPSEDLPKVALLAVGRVFPVYSEYELGIATQMMMKAISKATGFSLNDVEKKFKKTGDLGLTTEDCIKSRKQVILFKKKLTVNTVFENLQKLAYITGVGSQDRKLNLIAELLVSAKPKEARYVVRTILQELRVGVAEGIIRDAIVEAFLYKEGMSKEEKNEMAAAVEYAWNILSDFGEIAKIAKERGVEGLRKVQIQLGKPIQVMLGEKAESIEEIIKEFGKVAVEYKYDGMRAQIQKKGDKIWIYTRRLEDVTKQFADLVEFCKKGIKAKECIVEGEVLGINPETGFPLPFQMLSQRIHRKYDIQKMIKEIPVQIHLFDVLYLEGKPLFDKPFKERRRILESIIKPIPKKFEPAKQLITDDLKEAETFYQEALNAKQEGVFLKVLDSSYVFGRHVGGWYKIKPIMETLDLVIVGATWGVGSRAKWLSSYVLACRDSNTGKFLPCGMMGTGLTEEQFQLMTDTLKELIIDEKGREARIRPKIVVEVAYQEIQKSPNYESGLALRFPRLIRIREDKGPEEADTIERVYELFKSQGRAG